MPTYTFPSTIYNGGMSIGGLHADEIESTVEPPDSTHAGKMRASLRLTLASGLLTAGRIAITIPHLDTFTLSLDPAPAVIPKVGPEAKRGSTVSWDFDAGAAPAAGSTLEQTYLIDFTSVAPVAPDPVIAVFSVNSTVLSVPALDTLTFTPTV